MLAHIATKGKTSRLHHLLNVIFPASVGHLAFAIVAAFLLCTLAILLEIPTLWRWNGDDGMFLVLLALPFIVVPILLVAGFFLRAAGTLLFPFGTLMFVTAWAAIACLWYAASLDLLKYFQEHLVR
jgi:hypothetical protein